MGFLVAVLYVLFFVPGILCLVKGLAKEDESRISKGLRLLLAGLVPAALLSVVLWYMGVYVEYLWWENLKFGDVYTSMLLKQAMLWAIFFVASGALTYVMLSWPFGIMPAITEEDEDVRRRSSSHYYSGPDYPLARRFIRGAKIVRIGVMALSAVIMSAFGYSHWDEVSLFQHAQNTGQQDAVFGNDIAFYLFRLPLLQSVSGELCVWAIVVLGVSVIIAMLLLEALKAARMDQERDEFLARALTGAALYALLPIAAEIYTVFLWRYNLLYSESGRVFGATYMDLHFWLPFYWKLIAILVLLGGAVVLLRFRPQAFTPKRLIWAGSLLTLSFVVAACGYGVMSVYHKGNELDLETAYILRNQAATLAAFGLDDAEEREYVPRKDLTLADLQQSPETLNHIRLADWQALLKVYNQRQTVRGYYTFVDMDVDRYPVGGKYQQVMLAAREIDLKQLQNSGAWNNKRLIYTHGYGVCASIANDFDGQGYPTFHIKDFPPRSDVPGWTITRPEIYFGELTEEHVYVNTRMGEFDYPQGELNKEVHYEGGGGIQLGGMFRRLAIAWEFDGFLKTFTSSYLTPETRLMARRKIDGRVQTLAPFLRWDTDGYKVIRDDGTLGYFIDGYTTSNRYPYSQRVDGVNYIRNSVKAWVDAYDGRVTLYVMDEECPIIRTWMRIFPGLFTPGSKMPDDLRRHIRYPEDMFQLQSAIYGTYHMHDPKVFFQREDIWVHAKEKYIDHDQPIEPYHAIVMLPGESEAEFLLMLPFTPNNRNNTVAWMAGRCDGDRYGDLLVYKFPKGEEVWGPMQFEVEIDQNPVWARDFTMWKGKGSDVIRGNTLMIPIEGGLIFVQPLYLRSNNEGAMPQLTRVIVGYNHRLAWGETFEEALESLFMDKLMEQVSASSSGGELSQGAAELVKAARQHFREYLRLTGDKKFEEAGKELAALDITLEQLEAQGAAKPELEAQLKDGN